MVREPLEVVFQARESLIDAVEKELKIGFRWSKNTIDTALSPKASRICTPALTDLLARSLVARTRPYRSAHCELLIIVHPDHSRSHSQVMAAMIKGRTSAFDYDSYNLDG
jgi:hypothetical protein